MIYEVTEGKDNTARIELNEVGENVYDLIIDGRTIRVDAAKTGRTIYSIIEDGKQFEAMVDERGAHGFDVTVEGRLFHLTVEDERSKLLSASAGAALTGPQVVEAQMPGKVIQVDASVGDTVEAGQGLVVVEAMKMENEIGAPVDGTVKEIGVAVGDTVESGNMLFVVEPHEEG